MSALNLTPTVDKNGKLVHRWMKSELEQKMSAYIAAEKGMTHVTSSSANGPRTTITVGGHDIYDGPLDGAHEVLRPGAYSAMFEGEELTLLVAENSSTALEDATPVQIDEAVAAKDGQYYDAYVDHDRALGSLRHYTGLDSWKSRDVPKHKLREMVQQRLDSDEIRSYERDSCQNALNRVDDAAEIMQLALEERGPMDEEFSNRGGWTRAYLAMTNGNNGHVHSSHHCSSLHRGEFMTRLNWMTDYSGQSQEHIIDDAGERACTICYKDAPTLNSALGKKTKMFSSEEIQADKDRAQRKIEAAERARVKDAKSIAVPVRGADGEFELDDDGNIVMRKLKGEHGTIETEASARMAVTDALHLFKIYADHNSEDENVQRRAKASRMLNEAVEAFAFKGYAPKKKDEPTHDVEEIRADILQKINAKLKKEKIMHNGEQAVFTQEEFDKMR